MDRVTFQDNSRNMRNPHTIDIQDYQGEVNLSAPQAYYTDKDSYADAWADQGHFPLHLDRVSHTSIPARGGARITFTGENFRGMVPTPENEKVEDMRNVWQGHSLTHTLKSLKCGQ